MDTARGRIVALTEAQRQFTAAAQIIQAGNDPQKETHLAQLERLKQLAEQEKLTAAEQQEAQTIVNALNGAYNDLGLGIDTITGKLNLAASAQDKFNEAMKAATLGELDAEIAELEANLKELQAEDEALLSYWNHNLWSQISGRAGRSAEENRSQRRTSIRLSAENLGIAETPSGGSGKQARRNNRRRRENSDHGGKRSRRKNNADRRHPTTRTPPQNVSPKLTNSLHGNAKLNLKNEIDDIIALSRRIQTTDSDDAGL